MRKVSLLMAAAVIAVPAAASAADLYVPPPAPAPMPVASGIWEGLYLGVHAGYVSADVDHVGIIDPTFPGNDITADGWLLGAQVGANFYLSDTVVGGVVADISWSNATGDFTTGPVVDHSLNWEGSLRAKIGFDGGTFLPYLTGGLAVANATRDAGGPIDTQTHIGWTIGAGVDVAVADNVSLNLEYRYSDYGRAEYETGGPTAAVDLTSHAVRAGVNFHF